LLFSFHYKLLFLNSTWTITSLTLNRFLHQAPLIRVALPLMLGVVLAILADWEGLLHYLYVLIFGILLIVFHFRKKWKYPRNYSRFGIACSSALFLCGFSLATLHEIDLKTKIQAPENVKIGHARLVQPLREGPNSYYGTFQLLNYWDGDSLIKSNEFLFVLYTSKDSLIKALKPGGELIFEGEIKENSHPINPHQFDYAAYLERKGIGGSAFAGADFTIIRNKEKGWNLKNVFQILQMKCLEIFNESGIDDKERSVLNALVLGYKSDLKPDTRAEFADAGVVHILAVSGLHVGIIFIVFQWFLNKSLGARFVYLQFGIILAVIWLYAGITGFSPSVLRASTMFSFIAFGTAGGKKGNTYNMLAASIILLLIVNPLIMKEIGFQLSYLAVIGIVFFHDIFKSLFWSRYWLIQRAWELFVVSVSAQIATAALSIYYFGQFPNYFFLSNLLVIPLATFSLYSGLLYLILHPIPIIGELIAFLADFILSSLTWVVSLFSSLPGSVSTGIHLNVLDVLTIYAFIILILLIRERPNRTRLRLAGLGVLILAASFIYKNISSAVKSELYVLEAKNGSVALFRSGKRGVFAPLYKEPVNFSMEENEYYLGEFVRKEGIEDQKWIQEIPHISENYLVYDGMVCFEDEVIYTDQYFELPEQKNRLLVLSGNSYLEDFQFEHFDLIILDRTVKDYQKRKLIKKLGDSIPIWDMKQSGIFKKSYSDFNF